jgi:hypothetical protein
MLALPININKVFLILWLCNKIAMPGSISIEGKFNDQQLAGAG